MPIGVPTLPLFCCPFPPFGSGFPSGRPLPGFAPPLGLAPVPPWPLGCGVNAGIGFSYVDECEVLVALVAQAICGLLTTNCLLKVCHARKGFGITIATLTNTVSDFGYLHCALGRSPGAW